MKFEDYLTIQIKNHPSMQPRDILKLCFQAAFGAEHLLSDLSAARAYFDREYEAVQAQDIPIYERISDHVCRVNLAAWKFRGMPQEWLFRMFVASAGADSDSGRSSAGYQCSKNVKTGTGCQKDCNDLFSEYIAAAENLIKQIEINFTLEDWQTYLSEYMKTGNRAVHHSEQYREAEKPSYRVIDSRYLRILPILEKAAEIVQRDKSYEESEDQFRRDKACEKSGSRSKIGKVCVIALDGRAASGKSTMAKQLQEILEADIVQMDDFFLPIPLRTEERFKTPGGNVHYERFMEEVLPYVSKPQSFSYRKFDCSIMDYNGECIIENSRFRIVEGSYSCHPLFGEYADITVFSDVDPKEQMRRITLRNGEEMAEMFQSRWIPWEEQYFEAYGIPDKAQIRIH